MLLSLIVCHALLLAHAFNKEDEKRKMVNQALHSHAKLFFDSWGSRLPSDEFIAAVKSAAFWPKLSDGSKGAHPLVLISLANHYAMNHTARVFVSNLAKLGLSQHVVLIYIGGGGGLQTCSVLFDRSGVKCVSDQARQHTSSSAVLEGAYGSATVMGHASFLSTGFAKILAILDTLSLGIDCLFLDTDQIFFKDPIPYILERDADVTVTGDCVGRDDRVGRFTLPPMINNNIGLLMLRARKPSLVRCMHDWLYHMVNSAIELNPQWDQATFQPAIERCASKFNISLIMLRPDRFPYTCMGPCGCDIQGIGAGEKGITSDFVMDPSSPAQPSPAQPSIVILGNHTRPMATRLTCPLGNMNEWIGFHFPCVTPSQKHGIMMHYLEMWENGTGTKVGGG